MLWRTIKCKMSISFASVMGFFFGFFFGVGCALAVMYSIYQGGYRAAVQDALLTIPPDRLVRARAKAARPA
jgi:hypothetical protein